MMEGYACQFESETKSDKWDELISSKISHPSGDIMLHTTILFSFFSSPDSLDTFDNMFVYMYIFLYICVTKLNENNAFTPKLTLIIATC